MFQAEMEYLESILPLLNSVSYLKHKQYLERNIEEIRNKIEKHKKYDFMHD